MTDTDAAGVVGINDLGEACLAVVFSFLGPKDCSTACCVNSLWKRVLRSDAFWSKHLQENFALDSPELPSGQAAVTYRQAFAAWQTEFADLAGPSLTRFISSWRATKAWLRSNFPELAATLHPGASRQQLQEAEGALGGELPVGVKMMYRLVNGQDLEYDRNLRSGSNLQWHPSVFHGLFGGYLFYDHCVNLRLLPVDAAIEQTLVLRQRGYLGPNLLLLGCSFRPEEKQLLVNMDTGMVCLGGMAANVYGMLSPVRALPAAPEQGAAGDTGEPLLRWFEEYARRLSGGWYEVTNVLPEEIEGDSRGINLFPVQPPAMAAAITRGVQVRCSSVYVPERSRPGSHWYSYCVRFSLLTPEEEAAAAAARQQQQGEAGSRAAGASSSGEAVARSSAVAAAPAGPVAELRDAGQGGAGGSGKDEGEGGGGSSSNSSSRRASSHGGPAAAAAVKPLTSCQLVSRRWVMTNPDGSLQGEPVEGDGVIGKFPILVPGQEEFSYQSCTHQQEAVTQMDGSFAFVEGSMMQPSGPRFDVKCPRMVLEVPQYYY